MGTRTDRMAGDLEEIVRGDRDYLWHHIKPNRVFNSAEQMIVVGGRGLFCGIEFVRDKAAKEPISEAEMAQLMGRMTDNGVLAGRTNTSLPGNNTIMNFAPSLTATKADIDRIVLAVKKSVEEFIV